MRQRNNTHSILGLALTLTLWMFGTTSYAQETFSSSTDLALSSSILNSPVNPDLQPIIREKTPTESALEALTENRELDSNFILNLQKYDKTLFCLAQNTYWEAGGESFNGKVAIVQVVENRANSPDFPDTPCSVVHQKMIKRVKISDTASKTVTVCQFSWICQGRDTIPLRDKDGNIRPSVYQKWYDSVKAVLLVTSDQIGDIVNGATHFYAHRQVRPKWSSTMIRTGVIGNHTFMK